MSEALASPADIPLDEVDLSSHELYRNGFPHALFTRLRNEAPVWRHPVPAHGGEPGDPGFWVLSRHEDIQATNRDWETFGAVRGSSLQARRESSGLMLVSMDGAQHNRQRRLISAGFTPRMTARLEEKARGWAVQIIDRALEQGRCDFVSDVAYPLPMHMIADIVGIPFDDRAELFATANDLLQCTDPMYPVPQEQQDALQLKMFEYGRQLSEQKRQNPADDIWTTLTQAEVAGDDGVATRFGGIELDLFFILLTIAGSETTRNAITLGLIALLEHRDQLELLRREPGLMRVATDEIIRWASPVAYFARTAMRDSEIAGVPIAQGDWVTLWYPSGNRDEDVFEDPFRFDINRTNNPHIAFGGGGPHFCLGANLARREISILFEELLARVAEIEIVAPPSYSVMGIGNPIVVSPRTLPVALTAR